MTNQNFPRPLLDDAIDHAVRELVQTDPRPGLRRRVLDRITAPPARLAWFPKLLIPASAFAAIALAIVLMRPEPPAPETQVVTTTPPATSTAAPKPAVTPAPDAPQAPTRVVKREEPVQFDFGRRNDRVTATNVQGGNATATGQKPNVPPVTNPGRGAAQPANVRVEITITEQRDDAGPPKTLAITVADGDRAQVQSAGTGDQRLTVSARAEILAEDRVRVSLNLNYRGPRSEANPAPAMLTQTFASIAENGKALVVTQSREAGSTRGVKVELKATILR
jgi:hypothetical protein